MRAIVTVVGKDRVGIMSAVCSLLAEHNVNILDISQTIVQGFFNMMMVVDTGKVKSFENLSSELEQIGEEIGVVIKCQHEEIFDRMHRI